MPHSFYRQWEGEVTLDNCAREPIHLPGAVQPHGILIGLNARGYVVHLGGRVEACLGVRPQVVLGSGRLEDLVGAEAASRLSALVHGVDARIAALPIRDTTWHVRKIAGQPSITWLELEPASEEPIAIPDLRQSIHALRASWTPGDACRAMASETRRLVGYDRVMVYRFDRDDHGHVVAEAVRDDEQVRYLHHHFPEADIPAQARRLYLRHTSRLIVDADYEPAPIAPLLTNGGEPLDLSDVHIRSVSPIHCEYLRNIGVGGTFTISVVIDGRLWGLVACHHREPRYLDPESREVVGFLAEVFTWQLEVLLDEERKQAAREARDQLEPLEELLDEADQLSASLEEELAALAERVRADGAALVVGGGLHTRGAVPERENLDRLAAHVRKNHVDGLFESDRVPHDVPRLAKIGAAGCGLLGVVTESAEILVLFFRGELVHEQTWGSQGSRAVVVEQGVPRLSPGGSFQTYVQEVRGQSLPWTVSDQALGARLVTLLTRAEARFASRLRQRNRELMDASEAKDAFLAMLSHELRNPLNAMVGWSTLLTRGQVPEERLQVAHDAIHRNALAQKRLIDDLLDVSRIANGKLELKVEVVEPTNVVKRAVENVRQRYEDKGIRLMVHVSSDVGLIEGDVERLIQVLINLLTNALKFTPRGGHVSVRAVQRESWVVFEVQDDGRGMDPEDIPRLFRRFQQADVGPGSEGLGLGLSIVHGLVELHGGSVEATSEGPGAGSCFVVRIPVALQRTVQTIQGAVAEEPEAQDLQGRRIVVLDDQVDATAMMANLLQDRGAEVFAFNDPAVALDWIEAHPDLALIISDINMGPVDGYAFAREVRGRLKLAIPMIAVTAYARPQDRVLAFRAGFGAHIAKPIDTDELLALVASLTAV